jgi:hypothetical protein
VEAGDLVLLAFATKLPVLTSSPDFSDPSPAWQKGGAMECLDKQSLLAAPHRRS